MKCVCFQDPCVCATAPEGAVALVEESYDVGFPGYSISLLVRGDEGWETAWSGPGPDGRLNEAGFRATMFAAGVHVFGYYQAGRAYPGRSTIRLVARLDAGGARRGPARVGRIAIFAPPEEGAKKCSGCGRDAAAMVGDTALCATHTIVALDADEGAGGSSHA